MKKFAIYVALAIAAAAPGLALRLGWVHAPPLSATLLFGAAILGAGFLLSWGVEAAEEHVSQGLAVAVLALVTVLPEYAVDIYYTFQAGKHPGSEYVAFAAANMTGANRLLIGTAWPLIVLLYWWRSGKRAVELRTDNAVEVTFLALAGLYAFVIVIKGRIDLFDTMALMGLFVAYLWRVSRLPGHKAKANANDRDDEEDEDTNEEEVGPAAILITLPRSQQWAITAALAGLAAVIILAVAPPFAESLLGTGAMLGINKFLLIQWVAPLAGEAPEIVLTVLFVLALRPSTALGAVVSDKINQWTLLVGMIPLFYSLAAGHAAALPLDARQREEFFLTAAQSLFAISLLLRLRLSLVSGLTLLTLFLAQLTGAFVFRSDEPRAMSVLTGMAWLYLALAAVLFVWNRARLKVFLKSCPLPDSLLRLLRLLP